VHTATEVAQYFRGLGWSEFQALQQDAHAFAFSGPAIPGENCNCNMKPARLTVVIEKNFTLPTGGSIPGRVVFKVVGSRPDERWLDAQIYSIRRNEVSRALINRMAVTAEAVWMSFQLTSDPAASP